MSTSRAIRIPRGPSADRGAPPLATAEGPPTSPVSLGFAQPNRAGTQRAVRLTLFYLVVLALLYLGFVLWDRSAPGGSSPGAEGGLIDFSAVALVLAGVGVFLSLAPAPRAVERLPTSLVVVDRWGRRVEWTPLDEVTFRTLRHHPAGLLSDAPVDSVQVSHRGGRTRTYLVEAGLLPESGGRGTGR